MNTTFPFPERARPRAGRPLRALVALALLAAWAGPLPSKAADAPEPGEPKSFDLGGGLLKNPRLVEPAVPEGKLPVGWSGGVRDPADPKKTVHEGAARFAEDPAVAFAGKPSTRISIGKLEAKEAMLLLDQEFKLTDEMRAKEVSALVYLYRKPDGAESPRLGLRVRVYDAKGAIVGTLSASSKTARAGVWTPVFLREKLPDGAAAFRFSLVRTVLNPGTTADDLWISGVLLQVGK
jgi:hypothetical protein